MNPRAGLLVWTGLAGLLTLGPLLGEGESRLDWLLADAGIGDVQRVRREDSGWTFYVHGASYHVALEEAPSSPRGMLKLARALAMVREKALAEALKRELGSGAIPGHKRSMLAWRMGRVRRLLEDQEAPAASPGLLEARRRIREAHELMDRVRDSLPGG